MTLHRDKKSVTYIDDNNHIQYCSFHNFPTELAKKIKLMQYFDNYLWRKTESDNDEIAKIQQRLTEKHRIGGSNKNEDKIYVRMWLKEKYAMLFKLTNNTVQVNFTDSSKLVFRDSSLVLYRDKNGNKNIYTMPEIYKSKQKDTKRREYKYTQQLLLKIQEEKSTDILI
eukprot:TRINITY_DN3008_c0_g1_i1.p2 TRINITY_DN3008_c0_g1~~TRINITY_DN3008_c0_g1_i1.p2  ORF type:complete len:169 (+),score=19.07 TRINITY_DN3008_c0_g1_i1:702-1208(+)